MDRGQEFGVEAVSEGSWAVELSTHAIERYVERFQPCLDIAAGGEHLTKLLALHGRLESQRPSCAPPMGPGDDTCAWVVVDGALVLPLARTRRGAWVAKTCLGLGGISHATRERRRRRRIQAKRGGRR